MVTFTKMETNRTSAHSQSLLAPYTVDPATLNARVTWTIDAAKGTARFEAPGTLAALFPTRIFGGGAENQQGRQYDVTRDGRSLIHTVLDDVTAAPFTLIQNWQPDAKK